MNQHYAAVIADLRTRRSRLEAELRDVDAAITGIQRIVGQSLTAPVVSLQSSPLHTIHPVSLDLIPENVRYANISVRWGVLWHLSDFSQAPEKTGEIASAILAGGYKTDAERFGNMVSAVLSAMKSKGEVETNEDGAYRITEDGRRTWQMIRQGTKFRIATQQAVLPVD